MVTNLSVGLSSWIVCDGNYSDFTVGSTEPFALEFYSERGLKPSSATSPKLVPLGDARYEATGRVAHLDEDWWVIDFGVLMYREERPPAGVSLGNFLVGQIDVGVDPFFYFEALATRVGAPPLIYDWRIEGIGIETAPFVEIAPRTFIRDSTKLARKAVSQTDAWNDDNGSADYVLQCSRMLDTEPRYSRSY